MSTYEQILHSLSFNDFVTRKGWNNKKLAVRPTIPFDVNSLGLYELGKWKTDYIPTEADLKAKDWIAISDREAEEGDAIF